LVNTKRDGKLVVTFGPPFPSSRKQLLPLTKVIDSLLRKIIHKAPQVTTKRKYFRSSCFLRKYPGGYSSGARGHSRGETEKICLTERRHSASRSAMLKGGDAAEGLTGASPVDPDGSGLAALRVSKGGVEGQRRRETRGRRTGTLSQESRLRNGKPGCRHALGNNSGDSKTNSCSGRLERCGEIFGFCAAPAENKWALSAYIDTRRRASERTAARARRARAEGAEDVVEREREMRSRRRTGTGTYPAVSLRVPLVCVDTERARHRGSAARPCSASTAAEVPGIHSGDAGSCAGSVRGGRRVLRPGVAVIQLRVRQAGR